MKRYFTKISKLILVSTLITAWIFSGFPQIWNFPPSAQKALAATVTYVGGQVGSSAGVSGNTTVTFSLTGGSNTTPQAGDLVVISFSNGDTAQKTLTIKDPSSVSYTIAGNASLYQNGTSYDSNFIVGYKFMPATPDSSALLAGGDTSGGRAWSVHVFRGVDSGKPLDVAAVTAGGTGTHLANPGAITPITSGAWIYVAGAGATATGANYTAAYLTAFLTKSGADTQDGDVGAGYVTWSSGAYDPVAFTGGGTDSSGDSWNAVTLALRPASAYNQVAYRLFNNANSTDVGSALATQDTAATLASAGAAFRLRMLLYQTDGKTEISGQSFKLQFAQRGADNLCDTAFSGETYADVTTSTVIAYNDNATPVDGAALTANVNDPTDGTDTIVNQTYEELNNFTNSVAAIPSGQDGKWDFSLKDNGATANTAYCFRAVKSDGTVLNTYTVIPQITTAASAVISVSVSDGTVTYGTLPANTAKSTCTSELNDAQTLTNNGTVTENFNIRGQNSANWTLGSTAGSNIYVHKFLNGTCSTFSGGTALTTSDAAFATGVAVSGTATLNLQVNTPNPSTVYTQQSVDVTITAVQQ